MNNGISKLIAISYLYLTNAIKGRQFVKQIDILVSSDQLSLLPTECREAFDNLHEDIARCVWDDQTYSEAPDDYIKESTLKMAVKDFISMWGGELARHMWK